MVEQTTWITLPILSRALGIAVTTVLDWRKRGILPPHDISITPQFRRWKLETLLAVPQIGPLLQEYVDRQREAGQKL